MRIEELIIDGFKSYPVRTHVSGFDASFNAITGLNGSGKSNILDSICFVLGITNLSAVRASNLQDLIYKRGQAGITKASVTIVFDNSDRKTSPVSFENYNSITVTRQIAMGGLSKYLINGHKATQQSVQNLFQSVQLNINNPNFLIMQGKITKVLNMKPVEILSMIEEAAGTRMFEDRKEKAFRTMNKKDMKVKEITAILAEEITPKLDKLREEKRSFLEYQKATTELERLTRLAKAYEWQSTNLKLSERKQLVETKRSKIRDLTKKIDSFSKQIKNVEEELIQIEKKKEMELLKGGKLQELVLKEKEMEHDLVKEKTNIDFKVSGLEEEKKKFKNDEENLKNLEEVRLEKEKELKELNENFKEMKENHENSLKELNQKDELLQTLLTGMASNKKKRSGNDDDEDEDEGAAQGGYIGALAAARSREANSNTEISQTKLRISHLEKELKNKEPLAKKAESENLGLISELEGLKNKLKKFEDEMSGLKWNEEKETQSNQRRRQLETEISDLSDKRDALRSRLGGLDFNYSDPEPNFDRSKVKGLIASLISLSSENSNFSTALEITAGGRLYNVVVTDEKVGSDLLSKGKLKKRVTLIPLNKISASVAPSNKISSAKNLAPRKVELALELIGYKEEVEKAMKYVFGNTLICKDSETAKKVTFDPNVRMKSVTVEGDVYDPAGTLSGGSKSQGGGILIKMQEIILIEDELNQKKGELRKLMDEIKKEDGEKKVWLEKKRERGMLSHRIELLEAQLQGSNATRVVSEVATIKSSISDLKSSLEAATEKQLKAKSEVEKFSRELEEFNANKDSKLDELKAELKTMKSSVQKTSSTVKLRQNEVRTKELELEESKNDVENMKSKLTDGKKGLVKIEEELTKMKKGLETMQTKFDSLQKALQAERATLSGYDSESSALKEALKTKKQSIADLELESKSSTHEIEKFENEVKSFEKIVDHLEKEFQWIVEEKDDFGKEGTAYDFDKHNMNELRRNCKKLEESQMGMKKKVNPMVLNMIDSVEKKETSLKQMLSTVLKDKSKIEATIDELDRYKKDALQTTWEKVNGDFGDIFAELLPGNYAKLQPPEGQELTQGLEVKVKLGTVWKQSLTELSGGQRSLIALSLIMSLLQFKPAPMYILDEIDAALDLSHTQHIGQLFKSRFSGSQFIVVSLKEGLFTNANVLFRARFRDGTSIVERVAQKSSAASNASTGKENEGRTELSTDGGRKKKANTAGRRAIMA